MDDLSASMDGISATRAENRILIRRLANGVWVVVFRGKMYATFADNPISIQMCAEAAQKLSAIEGIKHIDCMADPEDAERFRQIATSIIPKKLIVN